jgi:hypothetical protein
MLSRFAHEEILGDGAPQQRAWRGTTSLRTSSTASSTIPPERYAAWRESTIVTPTSTSQKWPRTVAEACRQAARELDKIEGKSGRPARDWYGEFTRVLALIAARNGIGPKVVVNPRTGKATGQFLDIAERFEQFLPQHMRSSSRGAIAKRLQRLNSNSFVPFEGFKHKRY